MGHNKAPPRHQSQLFGYQTVISFMVISVRQDKHTNKQNENYSGGWEGGLQDTDISFNSVKIVFYSGFVNGNIIMCGHFVKSLSLYTDVHLKHRIRVDMPSHNAVNSLRIFCHVCFFSHSIPVSTHCCSPSYLSLLSCDTSLNSLLLGCHVCLFSHSIPVSTHFF